MSMPLLLRHHPYSRWLATTVGVGAHGVGEIGITGVGAAVANAIYNACGKRIRNLPITLDKLL
jgi:CO/xanthine dehydrogenase Mo-binding subunit